MLKYLTTTNNMITEKFKQETQEHIEQSYYLLRQLYHHFNQIDIIHDDPEFEENFEQLAIHFLVHLQTLVEDKGYDRLSHFEVFEFFKEEYATYVWRDELE